MLRRKYVVCWFLVPVLMLLVVSISIAGITVDDMVDANQKIPIIDYANVNTSHKTNADEIQIFPGIQWLEFNSNGIDFSKVLLWSDDAVINTVLRLYQTEESWTGLNSDFRFVSKDGVIGVDVSGLVFTTGIFYLVDADDILEDIIEDVRSRVFVAVINNIIKSGEYRLGHILARLLVHYDRFDDYSDALSYAREVLFEMPDIPNLVKDKLFLFHKESSGGVHHDPCSNVIDGFIPGQVREDLVSNLWDGICRGRNPLVERFRHSATCKLIPTYSPSDGKVYVYDTLCSIKGYPIDDAISDGSGGSGTDEDPQIFTDVNHTHILAPSYRCSKETNGPILCWESGLDSNEPDGRRNCWNGWKWYQFNGEVSEVADHRTDPNWITIRDRNMCAEVYNSNGNSDGGNSGGSGSGYTDDSGTSSPWAGYNKHVGLKYMKIGKKSSGHWSSSKTWTEGEIPSKRDFRIKLKQKGGVWPDEACAEVWFSGPFN